MMLPEVGPVRLNEKLEGKIAILKDQIAEADLEKATLEDLFEFSRSLFGDIAAAWTRAGVDQKRKVQNALFPSGLMYHPEKGILNPENGCISSQLQAFLGKKNCLVEAGRIELPSEETNDREHSCFSQVHLCLVSVA